MSSTAVVTIRALGTQVAIFNYTDSTPNELGRMILETLSDIRASEGYSVFARRVASDARQCDGESHTPYTPALVDCGRPADDLRGIHAGLVLESLRDERGRISLVSTHDHYEGADGHWTYLVDMEQGILMCATADSGEDVYVSVPLDHLPDYTMWLEVTREAFSDVRRTVADW